MSARGSRPKISSDSAIAPPAAVERGDLEFHHSASFALGRGRSLGRSRRRRALHADLPGIGSVLRQRPLDRVAHLDPAALGAGNRALDHDQAALDVGARRP